MRVRRTKPNSFETILIIEMQVENKHFKNICIFYQTTNYTNSSHIDYKHLVNEPLNNLVMVFSFTKSTFFKLVKLIFVSL
jgi:hypothetical protein